MTDVDYMRRAIELAQMGEGFTNPNPMVGAVIVKEDRVIVTDVLYSASDIDNRLKGEY